MTDENRAKYNAMIERINAMSAEEIDAMAKAGKCPFEPEHLLDVPLGMFHCEVCGEMVVAGLPHPPHPRDGKEEDGERWDGQE